MTSERGFEYIRRVDAAAVSALRPGERYSQKLTDQASGQQAAVAYIRTPPGGGSPRGMHVHDHEQIFFVLEGDMTIEVGGEQCVAGPGSLIVFPPGVPHRNWNESDSATVHLAVNTPMPTAKPAPDTPPESALDAPGTGLDHPRNVS